MVQISTFTYVVYLLWCHLCCGVVDASRKQVDASLSASWGRTPLILEALEFLVRPKLTKICLIAAGSAIASPLSPCRAEQQVLQGDVDSDLFTQGSRRIQQLAEHIDPAECWSQAWNVMRDLLPPELLSIFYLHMSTRHFSARVEAFRNMYMQDKTPNSNETCAVANLHGEIFVDPHELRDAILACAERGRRSRASSDTPSPLEHIFHRPYQPDCHVVLYAAPLTSSFAAMDAAITDAMQAGAKVSSSLRPVLLDGCAGAGSRCLHVGIDSPPVLAGYGVELFIKDTEYSQACLHYMRLWILNR